jgi:hypothetical protein
MENLKRRNRYEEWDKGISAVVDGLSSTLHAYQTPKLGETGNIRKTEEM